MRAVILAGGLGTRLRPVVGDVPKALAAIRGEPFLSYQLALLRTQGIGDVVLAVGHGREKILDHFGSGEGWGVKLSYSPEDSPLGTGGAVRLASAMFDDDSFLVLNGDTFLDASLDKLRRTHETMRCAATIALTWVPDAGRFGRVLLDRGGRVERFVEKGCGEAGLINAGVYMFRRSVLDRIPAGVPCSLEREVFPGLARGRRLAGCVLEGFHLDIGTPESYQQAQTELVERART